MVNGADGIGTGWSTTIPCYNPLQIAENLKRRLRDKPYYVMDPWYQGYKGRIFRNVKEDSFFTVQGKYEVENRSNLRITELPLKKWTRDYKAFLENLTETKTNSNYFVEDIKEFHTQNHVDFSIKVNKAIYKKKKDEIFTYLRLQGKINLTNLVLFNHKSKLRRYEDPVQIIEEFFKVRLKHYFHRK